MDARDSLPQEEVRLLFSHLKGEVSYLDVTDLLEYLPHRHPMVMVDRVVSYCPGESVVALKCVTYGEAHFAGHFPKKPVMPGVLILESMAQTGTLLALFDTRLAELRGGQRQPNDVIFLAAVDKVKYRRPVVPGDVMRVEALTDRISGLFRRYRCSVRVDGKLVASAVVMATGADV